DRQRREFREFEVSWQYEMVRMRLDYPRGVVGVVRSYDAAWSIRGGSPVVVEDAGAGGPRQLSGTHGGSGVGDEHIDAAVVGEDAGSHGAARWRALAHRRLAAAGGRWLACQHTANSRQRAGLLCGELRSQRDGQVSRQETAPERGPAPPKTVAAAQTANLVDFGVAHGTAVALVLADRPVEFERAGAFAGPAENADIPEENPVLRRRRIRGLRFLARDCRSGPPLPDASGQQRHPPAKARLCARVAWHRLLLAGQG